jgi:twinkle protein
MDIIFGAEKKFRVGDDITQALDTELELLAHGESNHVLSAESFADEIRLLAEQGDTQAGEPLPWEQDIWFCRPGELTIWGGINKQGKSLILGQVILNFLKTQTAAIASLEMKPAQTVYRMICQAATCKASAEYCDNFLPKLKNRLFVYNKLGSVGSDRILAFCYYAKKTLGVDHIVVDSLMKCGLRSDDRNGEKSIVDRLQEAAKTLNVHIHLVCHVRKPEDETKRVGKMDIKGDGSITDLADNIIIYQQNKLRRRAKEKLANGFDESKLTQAELKALDQHDAWLTVEGNRHGSKEGIIGLYYHEPSGQFTKREGVPMRSLEL